MLSKRKSLWDFGVCVSCGGWGGGRLTHCGLVTPYSDRDLGQHWLRQWLVAWRHQAITWTNVDWSSMKSSDIHIRAISQGMLQPSINKIRLKKTNLEFNSNFPGANELNTFYKNKIIYPSSLLNGMRLDLPRQMLHSWIFIFNALIYENIPLWCCEILQLAYLSHITIWKTYLRPVVIQDVNTRPCPNVIS